MMGMMPAGMFGLNGIVAGDGQSRLPQMPDMPFQWGAGGARLSPDDIAARAQLAQQQMAGGMDYSPVQSWAQGAARVAQALVGKRDLSRLSKASAANAAESSAALSSLGTGGDEASIAAILANPNLGQGVRDVAKLKWQDTHRAPIQPPQPTEFERMVSAAGYQPGTPEYTSLMRQAVTNKANPMQAVPGVDEQGNQILRFIRPSGMSAEGGGPASAAPVGGAAPPVTLPPDFDFGGGGPASQAPATFR